MDEDYEWTNLRNTFKVFSIWFISGLIDAIFLVLWVGVQWLADLAIKGMELSGIDLWLLSTFQILFALSTLLPIIIYIIKDISILSIRTYKIVRREFSETTSRKLLLPSTSDDTGKIDELPRVRSRSK